MRSVLAAFRFLTVLPLPGGHRLAGADWGRATAWYPAVGLVLGALLAGLDAGLRWLLPVGAASAVLLAAWVALTGALHLDGFIDCCDALPAAVPVERRLEILRDVHTGAFGVAGAVLLLLGKAAGLAALPAAIRLPALLLIPALARWGMAGAVLLFPYARPGPGLGRMARTGAGRVQLAIATSTALLAAALAGVAGLGWAAALLLAGVAAVLLAAALWMQRRLHGLTGDAYGALCEVGETAGLLLAAALAHRGVLP